MIKFFILGAVFYSICCCFVVHMKRLFFALRLTARYFARTFIISHIVLRHGNSDRMAVVTLKQFSMRFTDEHNKYVGP